MSTLSVSTITDASGGNTATINSYTPTESNMAGRNRIINGDMRIDQRNAGASQSVANGSSLYTLDRWRLYYDAPSAAVTSQQSTTTTTGFSKSLSLTVGTAGSIASGSNCTLTQQVEGFNCEGLALSTSEASPLSLSFWVRSSVTGTFNASITVNGYSYVSTYTINAVNTFEYKTIAIPALTIGTPAAINNSAYINLRWDLGCGSSLTTGTANSWVSGTFYKSTGTTSLITTSGATFYITGVQLEAGSVATPFERRQYGQELALCQRYALMIKNGTTSIDRFGLGSTLNATTVQMLIQHPVQFRAAATLTTTGTASDYLVYSTAVTACSAAPTIGESSQYNSRLNFTTAGGLTGGQVSQCTGANTNAYLLFSAEL